MRSDLPERPASRACDPAMPPDHDSNCSTVSDCSHNHNNEQWYRPSRHIRLQCQACRSGTGPADASGRHVSVPYRPADGLSSLFRHSGLPHLHRHGGRVDRASAAVNGARDAAGRWTGTSVASQPYAPVLLRGRWRRSGWAGAPDSASGPVNVSTGTQLSGRAAVPGGRAWTLFFQRCGDGCFAAPVTWHPGTSDPSLRAGAEDLTGAPPPANYERRRGHRAHGAGCWPVPMTAAPQPRARSRLNAALISERWVNACGKLPSCSPVGPISSAYRPRWLA
jgi:hypothetical protein